MGTAYSQPIDAASYTANPHDAPMFEDISEYQRCKLSSLKESEETWKDVFHAKRLISFQGFDEIFGHILGDPDEHFGLFTGDDVKKRARARALALAQLRKLHGGSGGVGDSFMAGGADKRRRTRSGSTARNSMMLGGSFAGSFSGAASMGGFGANMGSVANIAMSVANATKGARESRTSKAQVDKYKAGAMIDVYEVFSVLALLCNDDVEVKLTFIFMFFARNGSKPGGMDSKQFADMLDRVGIGVYKVLGFSPPPKQFLELAILGLFGKKGQVIRDVLNFKECWDWCQDDVEVSNYLQKILNFSLTPSSMYKQEAQVNTDSYLQNSKLMEGDSDDEDENASGILKHRPRLWTELSSKFSNKRWWENMEQLQTKATLLSALKAMHADDRVGLPVFDNKTFKGVLDCMEMARLVVEAWNTKIPLAIPPPTTNAKKGLGDSDRATTSSVIHDSPRRRRGVTPSGTLNSLAGIATGFCYKEVEEGLADGQGLDCIGTHQFSWNLIHKFANGARSVAMINSFPPVASSVVFVMHASDVAKYLSRNMDLLPHSQAIRKMLGLTRKPGVVRFDTPMIDCLKLMVKKRSDALAVVNEEGEFCGEVRIEDVRNLCFYEMEEDEEEKAEGVEEVKRVVRMTMVAIKHKKAEESAGGEGGIASPSPGGTRGSLLSMSSPGGTRRSLFSKSGKSGRSSGLSRRHLSGVGGVVGGGKGGGGDGGVEGTAGGDAADDELSKISEDVAFFRQFTSLMQPVATFLKDCYCTDTEHLLVGDEKPAVAKLKKIKLLLQNNRLNRQITMVDKVCKAFEEGIGPVGRERAKTRMLIAQKKSGTIMVLKGQQGQQGGLGLASVGEGDENGNGGEGGRERESSVRQERVSKIVENVKDKLMRGDAGRKSKRLGSLGDGGGADGDGGKRKTGWGSIKQRVTAVKMINAMKPAHARRTSILMSAQQQQQPEEEEKKDEETIRAEREEKERKKLEEENKKKGKARVGLRPDGTVRVGDSLGTAISIMAKEKKSRVFVVNSHFAPISVITLADVCRLVLSECEKEVAKMAEAERLAMEEERTKKEEDDKQREIADREAREAQNKQRIEARSGKNRVEQVLEVMGGGHRAISIKSQAAMENSVKAAGNGGVGGGGWKEGGDLNPVSIGGGGGGGGADTRPSIAVLYEVEGGLGNRVRADTGQTEDVITIKTRPGRMASIVLEEEEEEEEEEEG
ncbi:hypothetical protein TrST_g8488 [Triparma strigata]|uniref:CBS domain-containing protein n=1 Tax=Triparma strigata TaxID=1606541 RepID=A0A9W7APG2_9STRA|nr:hypothetical protein TrST_g8488 [Triparma strigata]